MTTPPLVERGTLVSGANDFTPAGGKTASQIAVENLEADGGNSFDLAVNDSNTWRMAPGDKLGLRFKNGVFKVTLTPVAGNPAYQLLIG